MTECTFVDTNILLRHLLGDNERHSAASTRLLGEVASGSRRVMLSATVIFETVYMLTKHYGLDRVAVARELRSILEFEAVILPDKVSVFTAFDLFTTYRQLSFADCYHAALAIAHCNSEIYTFDKDFDRVAELTRLEPSI